MYPHHRVNGVGIRNGCRRHKEPVEGNKGNEQRASLVLVTCSLRPAYDGLLLEVLAQVLDQALLAPLLWYIELRYALKKTPPTWGVFSIPNFFFKFTKSFWLTKFKTRIKREGEGAGIPIPKSK